LTGRRVTAALLGVAVAVSGFVTPGTAPPATAAPGPDVFLLGDSVLAGAADALDQTVLPAYPGTLIDAAACRGLASSCTFTGTPTPPSTGIEEIKANAGALRDVVVMELGYNDKPSATQVDQAMSLLTAAGVPLVIWLDLSTLNRPDMAPTDSVLYAATSRWPTLRVAGWDAYSHAHPDWFVADDGVGVHLTASGATAFAAFLRAQLDAVPGIGVPPPPGQHCAASVAIGAPSAPPANGSATAPASGRFTGLDPVRLLDSRAGRPVGAGRVVELQVTGRSGVPPAATAAALNVTAVDPCGAGYLTVFPCESNGPPLASNVNYGAGAVQPNFVVARLSGGGRVCIYTPEQTDVLVDLMGWFGTAGAAGATAASPVRVLDTRSTGGAIGAGHAVAVTVAGGGRAPSTATGAVLNLTAVKPVAPGFLTLWPAASDGSCDPAARPATSNVNYGAGDIVPNRAMVRVGGMGRVCVFSLATTDVVADLGGWFSPGSGDPVSAATPSRLLDTRLAGGMVAAGSTVALTVAGGDLPLAPPSAAGVLVTVTAVGGLAPGFVTVWPAAADGS
jgi:hypothetical protein